MRKINQKVIFKYIKESLKNKERLFLPKFFVIFYTDYAIQKEEVSSMYSTVLLSNGRYEFDKAVYKLNISQLSLFPLAIVVYVIDHFKKKRRLVTSDIQVKGFFSLYL